MDLNEASAYSPMLLPLPSVSITVPFRGAELPELVRQSRDYAAALKEAGRRVHELALHGEDHFSILEQLARADATLALEIARLAAV